MSEDRVLFAALLQALRPHLDSLIIIGGWATRLYRLHDKVGEVGFEPLFTDDADIAMPEHLPDSDPNIHDSLISAGFTESMWGSDIPPLTRYEMRERGFEVEFVTHQRGGLHTANERRATVLLGGVSAQRLANVRLLEKETWHVVVDTNHGYPVGKRGVTVIIPNPASFIAQKLLSLKRRGTKAPKDILYIHDTLQLFADVLLELRDIWQRVCESMGESITIRLWRRWAFVKEHQELFQRAARVAFESGRKTPPSPTRIRAVCEYGLDEVFG